MVNFHPDQLPPHGCTEFALAGVGLERASGGEGSQDKGKGKPTVSALPKTVTGEDAKIPVSPPR